VGRLRGGGIGKTKNRKVNMSDITNDNLTIRLNEGFEDFENKFEIRFTTYD
jgi:hypothetical protein